MEALNFYSPVVADQLRHRRKTATIRLGDKSGKYRKGLVVSVLAGQRFGVRAFAIGKPVRQELPLLIESRRALCFGDAVVGVEGDEGPLRVWLTGQSHSEAWYRDRLLPTLLPLAELDAESVLVGHGPAVTAGGGDALRRAFARPPWHRPG